MFEGVWALGVATWVGSCAAEHWAAEQGDPAWLEGWVSAGGRRLLLTLLG